MNKKAEPFFKEFFALYLMLVLQNVITLSVNLADNLMLGGYSEAALSGVAAVNQIQFVFQQIVTAFGEGIVILGSQYWGKGQTEPLKRISAAAMRFGIGTALLLFAATTVFPQGLIRFFTDEPVIVEQGCRYLSVVRFSYLFFAVTQIVLATLRSTQTVAIAFWLSVETLLINCGINCVLIYGKFGAPEMGVAGAAVGTVTARIVECVVVLCYAARRKQGLRLKWKDFLKRPGVLCRDYLKVTFPMVLVQSLWGLNTAMQTVILGHMTASAIAANSVASTLFLMVKSMAVGAASTASVIIGKTIGMGDMQLVKQRSRILQKLFLVIGIFSAAVLFVIRIPVLELYRLTASTKEMANTFLLILCIVVVGMSYQMPVNNGLIRGGGSASFVVKLDLISIWMIVIPVSLLAAFVWKASPAIVVCCLNADQIFKCVPAFIKVNYGNWARKLTRDERTNEHGAEKRN